MKNTILTTAAAAIFGFSSLSAQNFVIYDGGAFTLDASQSFNSTLTVDAGVGNPAPSASFVSTAAGSSALFAPTDSSYFLTPNLVDFSGTSVVSFDYRIPSGSFNTELTDVRLKIVNPNNGIGTTALDVLNAPGGGLFLTADGNWHTLALTAAEGSNFAWGGTMQGLFDSNDIDPTVPQQVYIQISGGAPGLEMNFDNVSVAVVPEPSTYALLFGLLAVGFVAFRRRQG